MFFLGPPSGYVPKDGQDYSDSESGDQGSVQGGDYQGILTDVATIKVF